LPPLDDRPASGSRPFRIVIDTGTTIGSLPDSAASASSHAAVASDNGKETFENACMDTMLNTVCTDMDASQVDKLRMEVNELTMEVDRMRQALRVAELERFDDSAVAPGNFQTSSPEILTELLAQDLRLSETDKHLLQSVLAEQGLRTVSDLIDIQSHEPLAPYLQCILADFEQTHSCASSGTVHAAVGRLALNVLELAAKRGMGSAGRAACPQAGEAPFESAGGEVAGDVALHNARCLRQQIHTAKAALGNASWADVPEVALHDHSCQAPGNTALHNAACSNAANATLSNAS